MDINVVYWYSHLGEKLLRLTYDALGVHMTGTIEVFGGCARSKAKAHAVRKNTYTQTTNTGEIIFVDTAGPIP